MAAGAYAYGISTLGPPSGNGGFQHYIGGFTLPFPLAVVAGSAAGSVVGVLIAITGLKRLRQDYQAMAMLVVSLMAATVISANTGLLNGNAGLSLIPNPFSDWDPELGRWAYVGVVAIACLVGVVVLRRFTTGPMGRTLRAMRDDETAAAAAGKDVVALRLLGPGCWRRLRRPQRRTARRVHRRLGALGLGLHRDPRLPQLRDRRRDGQRPRRQHRHPGRRGAASAGRPVPAADRLPPGLSQDFGWIVLGSATIIFIWVRPQGIFPERRPKYGAT